MKIEKVSVDDVTLVVPTSDVLYLYNALCVALEELGPSHFEARTQETSEYATTVRDQLSVAIKMVANAS